SRRLLPIADPRVIGHRLHRTIRWAVRFPAEHDALVGVSNHLSTQIRKYARSDGCFRLRVLILLLRLFLCLEVMDIDLARRAIAPDPERREMENCILRLDFTDDGRIVVTVAPYRPLSRFCFDLVGVSKVCISVPCNDGAANYLGGTVRHIRGGRLPTGPKATANR